MYSRQFWNGIEVHAHHSPVAVSQVLKLRSLAPVAQLRMSGPDEFQFPFEGLLSDSMGLYYIMNSEQYTVNCLGLSNYSSEMVNTDDGASLLLTSLFRRFVYSFIKDKVHERNLL